MRALNGHRFSGDNLPFISFRTYWDFASKGDWNLIWETYSARTFSFFIDGVDRTSDVVDYGTYISLPSSTGYLDGDNTIRIECETMSDSKVLRLARNRLKTPLDLSGLNEANMTLLEWGDGNFSDGFTFDISEGWVMPEQVTANGTLNFYTSNTIQGIGETADFSWLTTTGAYIRDANNTILKLILPHISSIGLGNSPFYCMSLPNATEVDMSNIDSISGSRFSSLRIYDNPNLTTITLHQGGSVGTANFYGNAINTFLDLIPIVRWNNSDTTVSIRLYDNGMSAALVNEYLVKWRDYWLTDAPAKSGVNLDISGTNAAPDGTSGGYDGLTAKADLLSYGANLVTS